MKRGKMLSRWICFLSVLLFLCPRTVLFAENEDESPSLTEAEAVCFFHADTKTLLCEKNAEEILPAGSTVKVIAGLYACKILENQRDIEVHITKPMVNSSAGYQLYLKEGDVIPVEQLLYAAICGSFNDAFNALAVLISEDIANYVSELNAYAKTLGAENTVYTDVCGIADTSRTTAKDTALIALAAMENEWYMEICSTEKYNFSATAKMEERPIYNRNALISSNSTTKYFNKSCRGMNAGYTENGGYCLVTSAQNNADRYICVVLGASEDDTYLYSYVICNRLLSWAFQTFRYVEIVSPDTDICTLPVRFSDLVGEVPVRTQQSLFSFLPADAKVGEEFSFSIRLTVDSLDAPVAEGTFVGYVAVVRNDKILGTLPLYTAASAERSAVLSSLNSIKSLFSSRAFCAGLLFFVTILSLWVGIECYVYYSRRHKWDKYFSDKLEAPAKMARRTENGAGSRMISGSKHDRPRR